MARNATAKRVDEVDASPTNAIGLDDKLLIELGISAAGGYVTVDVIEQIADTVQALSPQGKLVKEATPVDRIEECFGIFVDACFAGERPQERERLKHRE